MGFCDKSVHYMVIKSIRQGDRQKPSGILVSETKNAQLREATNLVGQSSRPKKKGHGIF
jgi:hypothetical protein